MDNLHDRYPIPNRLNIVLFLACAIAHVFLLWEGSQTTTWYGLLLCCLLFAVTLIPVYSLLHEAEHGVLHSDAKWNYALGFYLSLLFLVPFSFFRKCHLNHHKHNRTDYEMWDLYYENQRKWLKHGYLYLVMVGMEWVIMVVGTLLFCIQPSLVFSRVFSWNKEIRGLIMGSDADRVLRNIRLESYVVVVSQVVLFLVLDLQLKQYCLMYLTHAFVWSSQNYVNHAFSPRDIINGAHNHKLSPLLKYVYLNFNLHLAHHQNPRIPWVHLGKFVKEDKKRISFLKNYIRLWKGPVLTRESSPVPINE